MNANHHCTAVISKLIVIIPMDLIIAVVYKGTQEMDIIVQVMYFIGNYITFELILWFADINECETIPKGCDLHVSCDNTDGNHTCGECPFGYTGNGYTLCTGT